MRKYNWFSRDMETKAVMLVFFTIPGKAKPILDPTGSWKRPMPKILSLSGYIIKVVYPKMGLIPPYL